MALLTPALSAGIESAMAAPSANPRTNSRTAYEVGVLADNPVAFLQRANGRGQFVRFRNSPAFRIPTKGVLTVEYWMRPDALQFPNEEGSGFVYVLGKGGPSEHGWYGRMYSRHNSESRPNRISGYAFNPEGGLGAGSYFEDTERAGRWIHVVLIVNTRARSSDYPTGYTKIYKNGRLRDRDSLEDYNIVCRPGGAPLRLGTGYRDSYFKGAIGNVAFYDRELSASRVLSHFRAM